MGRIWSHLGAGLHICKLRYSLFENNSLYNHSDQLPCALCTQVAKASLCGKKHYTDVLKNQQQVAQDNSKENAKNAGFVTLCEASPIATASNRESVSIWWRHRCVCAPVSGSPCLLTLCSSVCAASGIAVQNDAMSCYIEPLQYLIN